MWNVEGFEPDAGVGVVTSGATRAEALRSLFSYLTEWGTLWLVSPQGEREEYAFTPADDTCPAGCNADHRTTHGTAVDCDGVPRNA